MTFPTRPVRGSRPVSPNPPHAVTAIERCGVWPEGGEAHAAEV